MITSLYAHACVQAEVRACVTAYLCACVPTCHLRACVQACVRSCRACMHSCVCACMHAGLRAFRLTCLCDVHACLYACVWACMCARACVHVCASVCAHPCARMCACVGLFSCSCVFAVDTCGCACTVSCIDCCALCMCVDAASWKIYCCQQYLQGVLFIAARDDHSIVTPEQSLKSVDAAPSIERSGESSPTMSMPSVLVTRASFSLRGKTVMHLSCHVHACVQTEVFSDRACVHACVFVCVQPYGCACTCVCTVHACLRSCVFSCVQGFAHGQCDMMIFVHFAWLDAFSWTRDCCPKASHGMLSIAAEDNHSIVTPEPSYKFQVQDR